MAKEIEEIYLDKEDKGLYTNKFKIIDPFSIREHKKIVDKKEMNSKSMRHTYT